MALTPTEEQQQAIDAFQLGSDMKLEAFAGTGKTSTLKLLAATTTDKGLYLAFNSANAADARGGGFPRTVEARTAHSLAYRWIKGAWGDDAVDARLRGSRLPPWETARRLNLRGPTPVGEKYLAPQQVARVAMETVRVFCQSADPFVGATHVPRVRGIDDDASHAELCAQIVPVALRAWIDLSNPGGQLRFSHDTYLKLWALTEPIFEADYVMLDEAQDTNPVVGGIFENYAGHGQRVAVGDANQAIYGWRGAVDFLAKMEADEHLFLTQSWRFGDAVASAANKWLRLLGVQRPVLGNPGMTSMLARLRTPDAVLCRTNAEAVAALMDFQANSVPVAVVGGGGDFKALAEAAMKLQAGEKTSHWELTAFETWHQVQQYVEEAADGGDLAVAVKLIDEWGAEAIIQAIDHQTPEDAAQVVISTAHKAKGREWARVQIAEDFKPPQPDEDGRPRLPMREEMMLAYVAVTRAREVLDARGLEWIDDLIAHRAAGAA